MIEEFKAVWGCTYSDERAMFIICLIGALVNIITLNFNGAIIMLLIFMRIYDRIMNRSTTICLYRKIQKLERRVKALK